MRKVQKVTERVVALSPFVVAGYGAYLFFPEEILSAMPFLMTFGGGMTVLAWILCWEPKDEEVVKNASNGPPEGKTLER